MKSILFIYAAPKEREKYINVIPPIGTLTLIAFLESKGIKADIIDCNVQELDISKAENYDVVGFLTLCSNVKSALDIAKSIKEKYPNKEIIVGGPHIKSDPSFFIKKDFIDAVFVNEAEYPLYEYLTKKSEKKIYLNNDWIKNLDELPFPALNKVDIKKYWFTISKKKPISGIVTSRGCPSSCIFCFHPHGKVWRARSAENVVDEIEWQVSLGVKELCILDDNFTLDINRAKKICDLIVERGIKITIQFNNGVRADKIDKEFLEKFKKAGGWMVSFAPETGNEETLKKIKKDLDLDQIRRVVKWSKEIGLVVHLYFIVGFPWETKKHLEDTINFAKELDAEINQFCKVVPYPSTELWEMINMKEHSIDTEQSAYHGKLRHTGKLTDEEISRYIKRGYRSLYLKPKKIFKLLKEISIPNLYKSFIYAIITESL